jgi:hypothetical protein
MFISSYTLWVGLSVWLGVAYIWWHMRNWDVLTVLLIVATCAFALGRFGYVALHYEYFLAHSNEIFSLTSPGYQEHVALVGGWLGWRLWESKKGPTRFPFLSALCLLLCLIGIAASLGCISSGCAYGREVFWQVEGERSLAWRVAVDWPDAYGIHNPRWPTQMLMAGWLVVVWLVVVMIGLLGGKLVRHWNSETVNTTSLSYCSTVPLLWLMLFTLGDFVIQLARGDASLVWVGLRAEQWADAILGLLAAAGIVRQLRSVQSHISD